MRLLNAVSRRAIDLAYVRAESAEHGHILTLMLDVNPKQMRQLCRDWHAVVDVISVCVGAPLKDPIAQDAASSSATA